MLHETEYKVVDKYDYFNTFSPLYPIMRHTVMHHLNGVNGKKMIDFGCGSGPFLRDAIQQGASHVEGWDYSEAMLQLARQRMPVQHNCLVRLRQADAFQPLTEPLPEGFDVASCQLVVQYCSTEDAVRQLFANIYESLKKPGGKACILVPTCCLTNSKDQDLSERGYGVRLQVVNNDIASGSYHQLILMQPNGYDTEHGRPQFSAEIMHALNGYHWRKDFLLRVLKDVGFCNVRCIDKFELPDKPAYYHLCEEFTTIAERSVAIVVLVAET